MSQARLQVVETKRFSGPSWGLFAGGSFYRTLGLVGGGSSRFQSNGTRFAWHS